MNLKIDHVTVCGRELKALRGCFASVGLASDYGGRHANGVTHMALVGFEDGSYLELIAPIQADKTQGAEWAEYMHGDAEPCAWAVGTSDIEGEVARLRAAGVTVKGPVKGGRKRQDRTLLQWQTAAVGEGSPGSELPFLIEDITVRALRVQTSLSLIGTGLRGIATVVLGVRELGTGVSTWQQAYGWAGPQIEPRPEFSAQLAFFRDTPVVLATPLQRESWLATHLSKFRDSPVAFLLGTLEMEKVERQFGIVARERWFGRRLAWFSAEKLQGLRIGVLEREQYLD